VSRTPTELDAVLPPFVAFVIPEECRVHLGLPQAGELNFGSPGAEPWKGMNLHQARAHIYGAKLSRFDEAGNAQVKGWLYRYSVDGGATYHPIGVDREQVRVAIGFLSAVATEAPIPTEVDHLGLRCPSPSAAPVQIELSAVRCRGSLLIADASGRLIWATEVTPDTREITWPGTDTAGQKAAAGVYFVRALTGTESAFGRITLVR